MIHHDKEESVVNLLTNGFYIWNISLHLPFSVMGSSVKIFQSFLSLLGMELPLIRPETLQ